MIRIVYSFNKRGPEAEYWTREIAAASNEQTTFIPFNHDRYLNPNSYIRAQLLDNLYYFRNPDLLRLYGDFEATLAATKADAVIVDNCPPYHPDYLRHLPIYKALRIADGPISAYDRDFAYLHAYDHIFYHSPAYSSELGMEEKLRYCGAVRIDFWPLALFDACFDGTKSEEDLSNQDRDIDVLFIGAQHVEKMPFIAKLKKKLGRRCRIYGISNLKRNLYFNLKHGFPGWVRPVAFDQYVPLYQRAKIGFNLHNRGKYTVGNYRLFDLPANGVMQISDGGDYLNTFFEQGREIVNHEGVDDLISKIHYYLANPVERTEIALNGYRRVLRDHRLQFRLAHLGRLIERGLNSAESENLKNSARE
jgi:spore maturation protein CgeB